MGHGRGSRVSEQCPLIWTWPPAYLESRDVTVQRRPHPVRKDACPVRNSIEKA